MKSFRFTVLFLWGSSITLLAQNVHGVVLDGETGQSIPFANISLTSGRFITQADSLGRFFFAGTPTQIVCSFPGFEPTILKVSDTEKSLRCALRSTIWSVDITGEKHKFAPPLSTNSLQVSDLAGAPTVLEADIFRSLRMIPGVKQSSDFSSGLYIRGGSPDQTLILLDGATVFNPSHFFGFFSAFNPEAISTVTLHKGGAPASLGGRMGSVLSLESKEGGKPETSVSLGLLSFKGSTTGKYNRLHWMLGGRVSTLNPVLNLLNDSNTDIPEKLGFRDLNLRLKIAIGRKTSVHVTHFSSEDALKMSLLNGLGLDLWYKNALQVAEARTVYQKGKLIRLRLTQSRYHGKPVGTLGDTGAKRDSRVHETGAELSWMWEQPNAAWEAGLKTTQTDMIWQDWFAGIYVELPNHSGRQLLGYLQRNRNFPHGFGVQWGIRTTRTADGHFYPEPRVVIQKAQGAWQHEVAYNRSHQWLSLVSNEAFSGFDAWLLLPEDKSPSTTQQFSIGTKYRPDKQVEIQFDAYYRKMSRIFTLDPFLADLGNKPYAELLVWGEGKARGLEIQIRAKTNERLQWNATYVLSQTTRRFDALNNGRYFQPRYNRLHDLTLNAAFDLNKKWQIGTFFTWASGQPYTRPTGYAQLPNPFGTTFNNIGGTVWFSPALNNSTLPAYHRLDFNVSKSSLSRWGFLKKWTCSLFNVYNHRNVWYYTYNIQKTEPGRVAVRQLPFIPNLSFHAIF
ncbi:MAG: TonB-dependent receptor plug domain-containing protein [Bacteroidetes Order II. Incertae sedis bacterium]|nr:TonB-dependent receptor plug domain-containing protein [Bacteroidetes Order II. bacterium]